MPRADMLALHRRAWEDWSAVDAMWAIATLPERRGAWDADAFFASGQATIDDLWATAATHGLPARAGRALDFGCGVGRLSRALATHCDEVVALDAAEGMVAKARALHPADHRITFAVHGGNDLTAYKDGSFDVVCCLFVLQHIPVVAVAEGYVAELARVTASGGLLIVQVMHEVPEPAKQRGMRARLRLRTRLAGALREIGVPPAVLNRVLGWEPPMALVTITDDRARQLLAGEGARVVWDNLRSEGGVVDRIYLVTK
jgi:2-polyprenyl-3-methyl-5-hydroxy-6-metoxy-1,4-benzoquinol methylase